MITVQKKAFRLYATLVFILAVLIFNGWFLNINFQNVAEQQRLVAHTNEIIGEIDLAISAAKDAETGSRGFLLTKDEQQLEPYRRGQIEGDEHIERIRYLTLDNPVQQAAIVTFDSLFKKRLEILNKLVEDLDVSLLSTKQKKALYDDGRALMENLRLQADKLKDTELRLLDKRTATAERSRFVFFWSLVFTTLLSLAIITIAFRQFRQNQLRVESDAQQKASASRMQENIAKSPRRSVVMPRLKKSRSKFRDFWRANYKCSPRKFSFQISAVSSSFRLLALAEQETPK